MFEHKPASKKILLVGDSHCKNLSGHLQKFTKPGAVVTSFSRPGAPFKYVVADLMKLTSKYTMEDLVIIFAGTNDIRLDGKKQYIPDVTVIKNIAVYTRVL